MEKIEINSTKADVYDREVLTLLVDGGFEKLISQYKVISRRLDECSKLNKEYKKEIASYKGACEILESDKKYLEELVEHLMSPDNIEQCYITDEFQADNCKLSVENLEINKRIAELEDRYQADCIKINQLQTTIDTLVDRLAVLRKI